MSSLLNNLSLYQENGVLENTQVFLLFIAFLIFVRSAFNQERKDRLIVIFFALLTFNFMLRELDVEEFDIPYILILLGSGIGRKILLAIGFISIFYYALLHVKYYTNLSINLLKSKVGGLLFMSAVFLFLGGFFEDSELQYRVFFEEMSELVGYILFLLASLLLATGPITEKE